MMKRFSVLLVVIGLLALLKSPASADPFVHITGESSAAASIVPTPAPTGYIAGDLLENDATGTQHRYAVVYKPNAGNPLPANVRRPWLSPSQYYLGSKGIGMEIQPTTNGARPLDHSTLAGLGIDYTTEKVQHTITAATDSYALGFYTGSDIGAVKYTGFAVKLLSTSFEAPEIKTDGKTAKLQIAQWWQGSPYGPPLCLEIVSAHTSSTGTVDGMNFEFQVLNDDTGAGSSVPRKIVYKGVIPYDVWTGFDVMVKPGYSGTGQLKVWQKLGGSTTVTGVTNGGWLKVLDSSGNPTSNITFTGKVGYNYNQEPFDFAQDPNNYANPKQNFEVYYGPYRDIQNTRQQMFFDEIRFADNFTDANPIP